MQRLRIKFNRGEKLKYISHLDISRLWQRILRRAGIPLAYSQGFSPHPRISLAAPLALGVTSEAELMDIFCTRTVTPHYFLDAVNRQSPPGVSVLAAYQIALTLPSLQAQVRFAEYAVTVGSEDNAQPEIEEKIAALLEKEELPWQRMRNTEVRRYDLRKLINSISLADWDGSACRLDMKLRCDPEGSGRPEQVTLALDFKQHPLKIHRRRLFLAAA